MEPKWIRNLYAVVVVVLIAILATVIVVIRVMNWATQ